LAFAFSFECKCIQLLVVVLLLLHQCHDLLEATMCWCRGICCCCCLLLLLLLLLTWLSRVDKESLEAATVRPPEH
jgi:hypothetical protein